MNSFKIGDTEFGVGSVQFSIEDHLVNLEITGNEDVFHELMEDDDSEWSWALCAPKIYFWGVPYESKGIVVDEDFLDRYDVALYMMEHNDFTGMLEITDKNIHIRGQVDMMGEILAVCISVERNF